MELVDFFNSSFRFLRQPASNNHINPQHNLTTWLSLQEEAEEAVVAVTEDEADSVAVTEVDEVIHEASQ